MVNPYQQYQNNAVLTASPKELTLMLYEGAIRFCNQAIEAIEKKELSKANTNILKAQAIIDELIVTLDDQYEIASDMKKLYQFINELLVEGNIQKDIKHIEQASHFIREFRDVWRQIMNVK